MGIRIDRPKARPHPVKLSLPRVRWDHRRGPHPVPQGGHSSRGGGLPPPPGAWEHRATDEAGLRSIPLFAGVSDRELRQLGSCADEVDLEEGKHLIDEGDFAYEFFAAG
jgi:hypothetical protein